MPRAMLAAMSADERARALKSNPVFAGLPVREIDALAAADQLFQAGVEAAPAFKTGRDQPYCLDGVPEDSAVRRHS